MSRTQAPQSIFSGHLPEPAGPPESGLLPALARALEREGIEVRWLFRRRPRAGSRRTERRHLREDLADLDKADALLAVEPPSDYRKGSGSRFVEFGLSIGRRRVVLLGTKQTLFHDLCDRVLPMTATPKMIAAAIRTAA